MKKNALSVPLISTYENKIKQLLKLLNQINKAPDFF